MSKHGQLYNEWLTHNTMDRYMSDHKDRMEHDTEIEEVNYETRDYDGIRWIRYDHYEHALHHQLQKATGKAYTKGRSDEAKTCTGCQGRCEEQLQKARHDWLREEIVRLEGMKEVFLPTTGEQRRNIKQGINEKLQTVIDRYNEELGQDKQ